MSVTEPLVGVTFTSNSPAPPGKVFSDAAIRNLAPTTDAANQHLLNFGGSVGDGCTPSNGGVPGDTDWARYDWSSVDIRVQQMQRMQTKVKMITLNAAPVWMMGVQPCDWRRLSTRRVLDRYLPAWADYVHFAVKRYMAMGVEYFQVWNELKGYWSSSVDGFDWSAYIRMYNAVWDAVKSDPTTAGAKIGGPYAIMDQHQNGWGGGEVIKGPWGSIDPKTTTGYLEWRDQAHGYDFVAVDYTMGDISGTSGGSSNPGHLDFATMVQYFEDVTRWVDENIAFGRVPIVAAEAYWGGASELPAVLDRFDRAGGDVFLIWHERPGVAGTIVDAAGNPTDLAAELLRRRGAVKHDS